MQGTVQSTVSIPAFIVRSVLLVVLAVAFVLFIGRPAHADPHAIFYTTVGQQQLFFNVLAALDQADYVETAEQRKALVEKRLQAAPGGATPEGEPVPPFVAEKYPSIVATEAKDFSAVLTRLLTLEGHDVYTDFLVRTFALEASRRNSLEEVANEYCEMALGALRCREFDPDGPITRERYKADRERAFIVDSLAFAQEPYLRGAVAALESGTAADQQKRQEILTDAAGKKEKLENAYSYDPDLARLTQKADAAAGSRLVVEAVKRTAEDAFLPADVNPDVFDDVRFDSNGKATFDPNGDLDSFFETIRDLSELPQATFESALGGEAKQYAYQAVREKGGSRADVQLKSNVAVSATPSPLSEPIKAIEERILAPAPVKIAAYDSTFSSLTDAESDLQYVPPIAEREPGRVELVRRAGSLVASPPPASPGPVSLVPPSSVVGLTQQGAVAGVLTDFPSTTGTHDPKQPYTPRVNPAGVHHEEGYEHFRRLLSLLESPSGCGCSLEGTVGSFGGPILSAVGGP